MKVLFAPALFFLTGGCFDLHGCDNEVVARTAAPSGQREAVMFQRSCGATTGFTTQISIVDPGEMPRDKGNVFIADRGTRGPWGGPWAELRWQGPAELLVRHVADARLFKAERELDGVTVAFEPVRWPSKG